MTILCRFLRYVYSFDLVSWPFPRSLTYRGRTRLQCLSSVTMACGKGFTDYAGPIFQRSVRIIHDQLIKYQTWQTGSLTNPDLEEPDRTFLIVSLDLLSGLAQGLGLLMEQLMATSNPPVLALVGASLKVRIAFPCLARMTPLLRIRLTGGLGVSFVVL